MRKQNFDQTLGHMTKMAAMPIYGKNLKEILISGTKRPMTLKALGTRVLPSLFK